MSVGLLVLATMTAHTGHAEALPALTLELGQRGNQVLTVDNSTDSGWRIDRVIASCECVRIDAYPSEVPAGVAADLLLTVTGKAVGQFVFQVSLYGDLGTGLSRTYDLPVTVTPSPSGQHRLQLATRQRDHALYRSAAELLATGEDLLMLDTRSAAVYRKTHIPGARRRDAQAIRRRAVDEIRTLVLVDDGWGATATERACLRLRENGSDTAYILRGGLAAWIAAGGAVQGTMRNGGPMAALTAERFLPLAGYDDWRLLVYTGQETVEAVSLSDRQVLVLGRGAGEDATIRAVKDLLADAETPVRVLLVDHDPARAVQRLAAVRAAGADAVGYISDGAGSLAEEILFHQQTRLASRQTITSVSRGGSPDAAKGGCSGCP